MLNLPPLMAVRLNKILYRYTGFEAINEQSAKLIASRFCLQGIQGANAHDVRL